MRLAVFLLALLLCVNYAAACSVLIESDTPIFENGEKIEFSVKLNEDYPYYIIEYWIEDDGLSIVKRKRNTTNQLKKAFTPKSMDMDLIIKARTVFPECEGISEKRILFDGNNESIIISFEVDKDAEKLGGFLEKNNKSNNSNNLLKYIPYFLMTLTALISVVLIWKR